MASKQLHTYATGGGNDAANREDLTDTIADLFADEVPAFKIAKKIKASATLHEWTQDSLAAVSRTGIVEGASITYAQPDVRAKKKNYTVIRLRNWDVTFTQEAVASAGVESEFARELMKAMKEIARDFDSIILFTASTGAGATGTARKCRGLLNAVTGNIVSCGTARAQLSEDQVNLVMDKIWSDGGNPKVLFCNGFNKRVISKKFSAKTGFTFNIDASTRKAIANINSYEGSFGTLQIIPERQILVDAVAIVDPDYFKVAILRGIKSYKGAATASSYKGWVEGELTLNYGNQSAHGKITDTTTGGTIS